MDKYSQSIATMSRRLYLTPWMLLTFVLIGLDQASKEAISILLPLGSVQEVTSFFNFVHVQNSGASFGFLSEQSGWQRWLLSSFSLICAIGLFYLMRTEKDSYYAMTCFSLIFSGAVGNFLDRVQSGLVIDFFDFHYLEAHWPAFNLADAFIASGLILYLYKIFNQSKEISAGYESVRP